MGCGLARGFTDELHTGESGRELRSLSVASSRASSCATRPVQAPAPAEAASQRCTRRGSSRMSAGRAPEPASLASYEPRWPRSLAEKPATRRALASPRAHSRLPLRAGCTSVRSPPPPTWSAPEAKACPFGVHHAHVARASALLDGAVLHELPVRSDSARTRGPVCIRTSCPAPQAYAPGPQEVRRRPVRPRPHVRQVRHGCGVARVSAQRATGHRGVSWPRPLAPGQAWARRACRRPGRARSQTAPPGRRRPRP